MKELFNSRKIPEVRKQPAPDNFHTSQELLKLIYICQSHRKKIKWHFLTHSTPHIQGTSTFKDCYPIIPNTNLHPSLKSKSFTGIVEL